RGRMVRHLVPGGHRHVSGHRSGDPRMGHRRRASGAARNPGQHGGPRRPRIPDLRSRPGALDRPPGAADLGATPGGGAEGHAGRRRDPGRPLPAFGAVHRGIRSLPRDQVLRPASGGRARHGRGVSSGHPRATSMNAATVTWSGIARRTFRAAEGLPLFHAGWRRTVFIHYEVDPAALQPQVPFPLDTRDGKAYVSLVAFTLADLRLAAGGPPFSTHGLLNVRTYTRGTGISFLADRLPNPF